MVFYILQFTLVASSAYLHSYSENKVISIASKYACFMLLFIPSALRYGIGTDYVNYLWIFNTIKAGGSYKITEFGWEILNILVSKTGLPFQVLVAIASLFTILPFFKTEKKDFFIVILLFSCLYYLNSFNITRQVVAMAIIWLAYLQLLKKEYINAYMLVFLAAAFHNFALIFTLVFFVSEFIPLTKKRLLFIVIAFIALSSVFIKYVLPYLAKLTRYTSYYNTYYMDNNISVIALLKSSVRYTVLLFMVFFIDEEKVTKKELNYVLWLTLLLATTDFIGISLFIIQRIRIYFFIAYIALGKLLIHNTGKIQKIVNICAFSFIVANYLIRYLWVGSGEVIPYTSVIKLLGK